MSHSRVMRMVVFVAACLLAWPSVAQAQDIQEAGDGPYQLMLPQTVNAGEVSQVVEYVVPVDLRRALLAHSTYEARAAVGPLPAPSYAAERWPGPMDAGRGRVDPGWAPGGMPAADADLVARAAFAGEWVRIAADEQASPADDAATTQAEPGWSPFAEDGTAGVFVSIRTNAHGQMWKAYPYKSVGKLLIYNDGAYVGYCSASVIGNKNILVTAAHCIYDRASGDFYDAFEFVPAERNGAAPFGTWIAKMVLAKADYVATGAPGLDVALVSLSYQYIDYAWRPVSYFTGWLGRVWDYDETQVIFAQGYPQALEDGKFSYTCAAESFSAGETDVISMGCDMGAGAYGGPWIYKFHPYRGWTYNFAAGVGIDSDGLTMQGVRFSSVNIGGLCGSLPHWDCGYDTPNPCYGR